VLDALRRCTPRGLEVHKTLHPWPLLGHPLSRLWFAARVANGLRGLLLTRAWHSLDHACALSPTFDEDGMRERRHCSVAAPSLVSARVAQASREPQDVLGAATYGLRRYTESTSAHDTVC
jgi:hypothetical protein